MDRKTCIGCKHNQAGRWAGWPCRKGVPGDDDDYSCWEEDEDKEFWMNKIEKKKCACCGKEKPVNEMKVCMRNQMHRYVCDTKCMADFYEAKQ